MKVTLTIKSGGFERTSRAIERMRGAVVDLQIKDWAQASGLITVYDDDGVVIEEIGVNA